MEDKKIEIKRADGFKPDIPEPERNYSNSSNGANEDIKHLRATEKINVTESEKKKLDEVVQVDFMDEEALKQSIKKPTNEARVEPESAFKGKTVEEVKNEIKEQEVKAAENFTVKDFENVAGFLISLIDTGVSTALRFWSGDTSDQAYSLPAQKRTMLEKQLTLILVKYQTKFSLEFMFICTLLIVYSIPFMKAREFRNKKKEKEADLNRQKIENDNRNRPLPPTKLVKADGTVIKKDPVKSYDKPKIKDPEPEVKNAGEIDSFLSDLNDDGTLKAAPLRSPDEVIRRRGRPSK